MISPDTVTSDEQSNGRSCIPECFPLPVNVLFQIVTSLDTPTDSYFLLCTRGEENPTTFISVRV